MCVCVYTQKQYIYLKAECRKFQILLMSFNILAVCIPVQFSNRKHTQSLKLKPHILINNKKF